MTITFRIDQGDLHPVFSMRPLSVADDASFLNACIDIADERDEKAYGINVEHLAKWTAEWDAKKDGQPMERPEEALDSEGAVLAFFAERDTDKEWIAEWAVRAMRSRQPSISFF